MKKEGMANPSSSTNGGALNTKQRKLLKRAQELEAGKDDVKAATTTMEGMNAKQRRLLKRAQKREQNPSAGDQKAPSSTSTSNVIGQKRKRPEAAAAAAPAATGAGGREGKGKVVPHIVFFGQLSYKTTSESLEKHIKAQGIEGEFHIRLLTDKATKKSKGQAFVEFKEAEAMYKSLSLHHTRLDGRVINVERSTGGGKGASSKRKEKLSSLRKEQSEAIRVTCNRIIMEKIDAGLLKEGELDEQAISVLFRYDGQTVAGILDTYCNEERSKLRNPSSYFMMLAKNYLTALAEGKIQAGASNSGGGGGKGGRGEEKGSRPFKKAKTEKEEHQQKQQRKERQMEQENDEGEGGEEEEEDRGWGSVAALPVSAATASKGPSSGSTSNTTYDEDDYDISQVFSSVRGRGGMRIGRRGEGRGGNDDGRSRGGGKGRERGGGRGGRR